MKLFNNTKKGGFFVEAGAYDGVVVSNTLLMEVEYGWTGQQRSILQSGGLGEFSPFAHFFSILLAP
jgi:hypothetical protein